MNSPPDPGSPISTDTSGSPPPDEAHAQPSAASQFRNIAAHLTHTFGGGSKRRLPGGSSYANSSSNRDPKTRRRGEPGRHGTLMGSGSSFSWEPGTRSEGKREERDLVDNHIVDYLRKEIGDPFQEREIKRVSQ